MTQSQFCCLDWSRVPYAVFRLPPEERAEALLRLVQTSSAPTCPSSFVTGVTPMAAGEHAAAVALFLAGAACLALLPLSLGAALFCGSWATAATTAALAAALVLHPIEVGSERAWSSWLVCVLFRYFSFRCVWQGPADIRERGKQAGPSLAFGVPHGVFPFGNLLACPAINLCGIPFVGTSADIVAHVPFFRWLTALGVVSASKRSIVHQLQRRGRHCGLVVCRHDASSPSRSARRSPRVPPWRSPTGSPASSTRPKSARSCRSPVAWARRSWRSSTA